MRYLLAVLAIFFTGAMSNDPVPQITKSTIRVRVTMAPDSTLRVATTWGYKSLPSVGLPDSTRLKVGLGAAPPAGFMGKFVKWVAPNLMSGDTSSVAITTYGTIQGFSCMVPHKGTTWGLQTCINWTFVRPQVIPPFDSVSGKVISVILRPMGAQVAKDVNGLCTAWLKNNPGLSPWIVVNLKAVPPCMGKELYTTDIPVTAQFCAFAILPDGSRVLTANSSDMLSGTGRIAELNYCRDKYNAWLAERNV